jgi:rhodanese-related sulfurtransferase
MRRLVFALIFILSLSAFADDKKSQIELKDYDSKVAHELYEKEGALLLDVRTLVEYKFSSIKGSKRIHVGDLEEEIDKVKKWTKGDKNHPIIVFCAAGIRAERAKKILKKHGYKRVVNLGGISDW